jgi:hypothetical protein
MSDTSKQPQPTTKPSEAPPQKPVPPEIKIVLNTGSKPSTTRGSQSSTD